ncbi:hypothetical protein PTSG_10585 [Salpingoeca rosetta]|uniref:Uncharacterized protein n=1 Tax=Salpingoeca rosetta (strain ATCC 50818 / BSB-021) TaxID=946362 RepID=F2URS5_SALR5|nr:uncharacterized protein PTSG_10585 [Salpingoeca rosetta]EGD80330.1 hypothetical protein PTSG_10585 [Salpingoeca rosetta]|eukprot:XP_004988120.1 hypothetical protein PTSG_10585 [Salpingoeca rosetta]
MSATDMAFSSASARMAAFVVAAALLVANFGVSDAILDLGDELTLEDFLADAGIDGCVMLTPSSTGYHFERGQASGLSRSRCTLGGACQCRQFEACDTGDCLKVYRCNDTESNGCVAVSSCVQTTFDTTFEVTVDCREPLDERDEDGIDFFGMRWKQALAEDCNIGRVCRVQRRHSSHD